MDPVQLTFKQVLEYIILGIKNKRYQAAINLAQDCINELNIQSGINQPSDSDCESNNDSKQT